MSNKSQSKNQCAVLVEIPARKVHGMVHDACYEISQGNLRAALDILAKADRILHIMCDRSNEPADV
jgi:hypothetical protein